MFKFSRKEYSQPLLQWSQESHGILVTLIWSLKIKAGRSEGQAHPWNRRKGQTLPQQEGDTGETTWKRKGTRIAKTNF